MYEGWDEEKEKQNRSTLAGKRMLAGMEKSGGFHEKREACIRKEYNADGIRQRILNGDGGGWIKEPYDPEVIFQLDRYHVYQEILRKISDKEARELYRYLDNNRACLLPCGRQGKEIPEPPEGVVYKGMGVQENQNCTVVTLRMKHRRMRWSVNGANNMAKALYRKENRELIDTIERYTDGLIFPMQMEEIIQTLSAAKAPKKDGKGNPYAEKISRHMPLLDAMQTASRKAFRAAFCH